MRKWCRGSVRTSAWPTSRMWSNGSATTSRPRPSNAYGSSADRPESPVEPLAGLDRSPKVVAAVDDGSSDPGRQVTGPELRRALPRGPRNRGRGIGERGHPGNDPARPEVSGTGYVGEVALDERRGEDAVLRLPE